MAALRRRDRVEVVDPQIEGAPAKIREIRIVGNKAFSEGTLKGLFELNDGGWLNFYLKGDRYSRAKLNADLETLRAYYQNRGYLEFEVESTQVAIELQTIDHARRIRCGTEEYVLRTKIAMPVNQV